MPRTQSEVRWGERGHDTTATPKPPRSRGGDGTARAMATGRQGNGPTDRPPERGGGGEGEGGMGLLIVYVPVYPLPDKKCCKQGQCKAE